MEVLCIAGSGGAIGLAADRVGVVAEENDDGGVPEIDLAPLLGPAAPGAVRRRIRVAARDRAVDLLTDAELSVRSIAASARHPVPPWIAPFLARIGVVEIAMDRDAVVLLADPGALAEGLAGAGSAT